MTNSLSEQSLEGCGPAARAFTAKHLAVLRSLPVNLCAAFLKEIRSFDTRFPAEQRRLELQCTAMETMGSQKLGLLVASFEPFDLLDVKTRPKWQTDPDAYMQQFAAVLWRDSKLEAYREACKSLFAALPDLPLNASTTLVVLLGRGASMVHEDKAFRRLRRFGTFFPSVENATGNSLQEYFATATSPEPYASWQIVGDQPLRIPGAGAASFTVLSYSALQAVRRKVMDVMDAEIRSGSGNPEALRSRLRSIPSTGLEIESSTPAVDQLVVDLFTEGSGTQLYSTSFVQWATREVLRRARPRSLLLHFTPRERQRSLNSLSPQALPPISDPEGSLIDADMASFYAYLEASAITQPRKVTMILWHEGTSHALLIGRNAPANSLYKAPISFAGLLQEFA